MLTFIPSSAVTNQCNGTRCTRDIRTFTLGTSVVLCSLLLPVIHQSAAAQQSSVRARRTLLVHGGGVLDSATAARAFTVAGGTGAPLLVVPNVGGPDAESLRMKKYFADFGATNVTILELADSARAIEEIRRAAFIFFAGGIQSDLMNSLANTGVPKAIRQRYHEGALVGGTSAGAALMSSPMITGEGKTDEQTVRAGTTELADGIGLWPKVIVDQHFVKRQRFARLLAAVLDRPELVGIGIDEDTGVLVTGDQFEVLGRGSVLVIDARKAKVQRVAAGEYHSATGLTLHVLRHGDRFDLAKR